jgi:hypothetical protein
LSLLAEAVLSWFVGKSLPRDSVFGISNAAVGATIHAQRFQRKPDRRTAGSANGIINVKVSPMTIKHKTWLADALLAASALVFVVYFILLEFSKARLP